MRKSIKENIYKMELKDLVGLHVLDAVDFNTEKILQWGDVFEFCQVCSFRLDGTTYKVIEDPDDGYRSAMKEIVVSKDTILVNVFAKCDVFARHRTKRNYGENDDVLELIDIKTGQVVLEVGTEDIDDYYPGFVARFTPENMALNKGF